MLVNKRILILCEDEKSSLLYFDSFKKDEKFKRNLTAVTVEVYHPKNYSPLGLVNYGIEKLKKSKEEKNEYNEVWAVFDKDGHSKIPQAFKKAKKNNINIAISIICFEYWVLLHFERTLESFPKCKDLLRYLKKNHIKKYEKSENYFNLLKDKINIAISNGKWVESQVKPIINSGKKVYQLKSYTDVYKLVRKLTGI